MLIYFHFSKIKDVSANIEENVIYCVEILNVFCFVIYPGSYGKFIALYTENGVDPKC